MSSGLPNASPSLHYLRLGQLTDGMRCAGYYCWPVPGRNPNEGHMDELGHSRAVQLKKLTCEGEATPSADAALHGGYRRENVNREYV